MLCLITYEIKDAGKTLARTSKVGCLNNHSLQKWWCDKTLVAISINTPRDEQPIFVRMFILVAIFIALSTYFIWTRRELYKLSWQLPGSFAFPLFGNSISMHPHKLHSYLDQLSKKYEGPIRLWLGPQLLIFIADAENVEILLKSKDCLNKPHTFYKMIRDGIGGDGLFTLSVDKWKVHRRLISPTISQSIITTHLPIFNKHIKRFVSNLPMKGHFFDILPSIRLCKIEMFIDAALGTEWEPGMKQRYLQHFVTAVEIVSKRSLQPLFHIDFIWKFTDAAQRLKEFNRYERKIFEQMFSNAMKNGFDPETFFGRLIDVSNKTPDFTTEDIFAETATILIGAIDTTSTSSAFLTLMLAMHPEYQEKVYQEVLSVMPNTSTDLTQIELQKLEFTDLCIKETLRLFPMAPLIGRVASKPMKLSNGIEVPANVPFIFGLRQIHIQEKYYGPTAHVFDPHRFLDDKVKNLPEAAYIPFSYGLRNCVGYHYAKVSVKLFIAHLIRNYRVTTNYTSLDQLHLVQNISLRLRDEHMVKLEPRLELI